MVGQAGPVGPPLARVGRHLAGPDGVLSLSRDVADAGYTRRGG